MKSKKVTHITTSMASKKKSTTPRHLPSSVAKPKSPTRVPSRPSSARSSSGRSSTRLVLQTHSSTGRGKRKKKRTQVFSPAAKTPKKYKKRSTTVTTNPSSEKSFWTQIQDRIGRQIKNINFCQTYLDAYEGDGWKRASLEKLRPDKELVKTRKKIIHAKHRIRSFLTQLSDSISTDIQIAELANPEDGSDEINVEKVNCSRCNSINESEEHNDILFCDFHGCHRAYHQKCLDPVVTEMPDEDEDWFCHFCNCSVNCLAMINDYFGTSFETIDSVFKDDLDDYDEGVLSDSASVASSFIKHHNTISDESEDDDYEPSYTSSDEEHYDGDLPTTEELLYHEKYAKEDIISHDTRSMRSSHEVLSPRSSSSSIPAEFVATGKADVGRRIAKLDSRDGLCFGNISKFEYDEAKKQLETVTATEEDSWFILYDDGDTEEIGKAEAEQGFMLAVREELYDKATQEDEKQEDEDLILTSKRRRFVVDYKKLNDSMFGSSTMAADEQAASHLDDDDEFVPHHVKVRSEEEENSSSDDNDSISSNSSSSSSD